MKLARRLGVSLKRLNGWEPATIFEYDDAGRLARSTPETEWDPEQVAWFEALALYESEQCPGCGGYRPETTSWEHDPLNMAATAVYQTVPGTPVTCHRCVAIGQSHDATEKKKPAHPAALLHAVRLAPRARPIGG